MPRYEIPDDMPLDAMSLYLHEVRWTPKLSKGEQGRLLECVNRGKQEAFSFCPDRALLEAASQARAQLVEEYQSLVIKMARRFARMARSLDVLDFIQEGNIGLLKAIDNDDGTWGDCLTTFVLRYVGGQMAHAIKYADRALHLPEAKNADLLRLKCAARVLADQLEREPTIEEVATKVEMSPASVKVLFCLERQSAVESLNTPLFEDSEADELSCLVATPIHSSCEIPHQEVLQAMVAEVLCQLTPCQQTAVRRYFGLEGQMLTIEEIADMSGVTEQAVYNTLFFAKKKMERLLARRYAVLCGRDEDGFYTATEAIEKLGVGVWTFCRWGKAGKVTRYHLEGSKQYFYSQREIDVLAASLAESEQEEGMVA